jgi:hypothetical protein
VTPFGRVLSAPGEVLRIIGLLRTIAANTESMARATRAVPQLEADMRQVAQYTEVLPEMHERMGVIEGAMPVLVDVQRSLARLPDTAEHLDEGLARMTDLLDRLLASLDELGRTVAALQDSIGPLSRLAERFPGRNRQQ